MSEDKHLECTRQFSQISRAWYGENVLALNQTLEELNIGMYADDGSTTGEFSIKWSEKCLQLILYSDPGLLSLFSDIWEKLNELKETPTPDQVVSVLKECGVGDRTKTVSPR